MDGRPRCAGAEARNLIGDYDGREGAHSKCFNGRTRRISASFFRRLRPVREGPRARRLADRQSSSSTPARESSRLYGPIRPIPRFATKQRTTSQSPSTFSRTTFNPWASTSRSENAMAQIPETGSTELPRVAA